VGTERAPPVLNQKPRPPVYYKFRPYSADPSARERGWVRETLFANRIRFSKASELNDPFEGRPSLVPQHKDPTVQKAAIYASVLSDAHKEGLKGSAAERQANFEMAAMFAPGVPAQAYQKALEEVINETFWVYSVCATRDPILMWSHYADGHNGIALHFDARVVPFDRVFEVHYSELYPEYPFPAAEGVASTDAARAMLYTKSVGWVYEQEFRAIRVLAAGNALQLAWRGMGVQWEGQIATLSNIALLGITLGAAMPQRIADQLTAELADRRPTLEVWRAAVNPRSYRLDFQRVR
jgi:DUF2971 family protein